MNKFDVFQLRKVIKEQLGITILPVTQDKNTARYQLYVKFRCCHSFYTSDEFIRSIDATEFVKWITQLSCQECDKEFAKMAETLRRAHIIYERC